VAAGDGVGGGEPGGEGAIQCLLSLLDSSLDTSVKGSLYQVSTTHQDAGAHVQIFSATLIQCVIAKR
jgi:hypothetical protein